MVCHHQLIARQAIQAEQQPAAELLVHRVVAVAHRCLAHLGDQRLGEAQHQVHHRDRALELGLDGISAQSVTHACALHHGLVRRGTAAHEDGDTHHALLTDHRYFRRGAVLQHIQQRNNGVGGEVNVMKRRPGFVEHLAQWHLAKFKLRLPTKPLGIRQRSQQLVLARVDGIGQWGCLECLLSRDTARMLRCILFWAP